MRARERIEIFSRKRSEEHMDFPLIVGPQMLTSLAWHAVRVADGGDDDSSFSLLKIATHITCPVKLQLLILYFIDGQMEYN